MLLLFFPKIIDSHGYVDEWKRKHTGLEGAQPMMRLRGVKNEVFFIINFFPLGVLCAFCAF